MEHIEENVAPHQQGQQQPLHIEVEERRPNMVGNMLNAARHVGNNIRNYNYAGLRQWLFVPPPPPPPPIVGDIVLPVVRRAHWGAIFPAPTVPPLLTPPAGWRRCIFTSVFSTVPDSLVWMTFALLCYGLFIYLFQFTEFFRTRKAAGPRHYTYFAAIEFFMGAFLVVYFYYFVHALRRRGFPDWMRNSELSKAAGLLLVTGISSSFVWSGESSYQYVLFLFSLVGMLWAMLATLRPPTDFNVMNGLFVSLMSSSLRVGFSKEPPPCLCPVVGRRGGFRCVASRSSIKISPVPHLTPKAYFCVIVLAVAFVGLFRIYMDWRAAVNDEAERQRIAQEEEGENEDHA